MERMAAACWPGNSGCLGTVVGGGRPQPGMLLGGNDLLFFRHEQREPRCEVLPCCPNRGENNVGGTEFQILLITAIDL